MVPGNFLDLIFVHLVLDSDLLRVRYLTILLPQGVVCARVGLVYFGYNYVFDGLTFKCVGAVIALSTEQANNLVLGQIGVNTHQHLHLEGEIDPVRLIFEALVFLALYELILLRRVVRLLEIVESLSGHPSKMLALDSLGLFIYVSEMLLESILLFSKSRLRPLRIFRSHSFGDVSNSRKQRLDVAIVSYGVVIFIQHLVLFDSGLVTLLTCFGRSSFLAPLWSNFAGIVLFFVGVESRWFFLIIILYNVIILFFHG